VHFFHIFRPRSSESRFESFGGEDIVNTGGLKTRSVILEEVQNPHENILT